MRSPKASVLGIVLGLCAATVTVTSWPATAAQAATAANTLVVNAATNLRPVTHVASGALYGLSANGTPAASAVNPLHPSSFVQMAPGGKQVPNGEPRPAGDALVVAPTAAAAGAKVIVRMPDWYPNFPYRWVSWSDWLSAVDKQVASVRAAGAHNIAAYEIWNEPDWTWNTAAAGSFDAGWVRTFREIRAKDPTTPIDGPSISFYSQSFFADFLNNAKANNALPDIVSWHELGGDQNIAADVTAYRSLESSLGISPRPIIIEEYATRTEVGVPGALVGYIAKFERAGVTWADLAFWNHYGTMGDTLVDTGGLPNAAWWLYKWYGDMSGQMVATVPPAQSGIDGAAAVNSARDQVSVIFGGGSGSTVVTVNGLTALSGFGGKAHAVLEQVVSQGRTTPVAGTQMISTGDFPISNGSVTVPIDAMNPANGYHLVITPTARTANTATVSNPVVLTVAKSGGQFTSVQAAVNAVPDNSSTAHTISIGAGTYDETVSIPASKRHLTLLGATGNPADVVIEAAHYAGLTNPATGTPYGTEGSATVTVRASDFAAEFVTFANAFDKNKNPGVTKTQAVALSMEGDRQVYEHDKFHGHQDTLLTWGATASTTLRQYVFGSVVDGDVDFIFGDGTLVVDRSTINVVNDGQFASGALVAPATWSSAAYGILITGATVSSSLAAGTVFLGRAWVPSSGMVPQAVIRDTLLSAAIRTSAPWVGIGSATWTSGRDFEFANTGPGAAVNASRPQLTTSAAANYTAAKYLAGSDGWNPVVP